MSDIKINKIFQGSCFDLINEIADESVDLIVCDGPYGITTNSWDKVGNIQEYNLNLIKILSRVLKNGGGVILIW